ncbi:MAG: PSD1 and planctomycete cytochrome C domain-containing protein [Blastocatellia bacterium]
MNVKLHEKRERVDMPKNTQRLLKLIVSFGFLFGFANWAVFASRPQAGPVDFKRDIEPIFAAACAQCHGAKKAAGQLRLDVKSAALKGGISGAVIVPGNSKQSRLLARILGEGGEQQMPLGGEPLKPEQIEIIKRWIDEGANWPEHQSAIRNPQSATPQHWAYAKPARRSLPEVKNKAWVKNPIDAFVQARLEKEGLQPSAEAGRVTLLRRVSLDLIGLPPTPQEVDEFLADGSNEAYEKAVDRLLASPHYGERWARPWLDLARYADSHGYEKDRPRVMWKYRDWVVNALNQDMPFDRFSIEQLAGDMLPNATNDQLIATGFHRNTMLNQEGGVDDEEARWETLIDRVSTTSTVWLGSTVGCAQCHNHKYDPFTQQEFYKLLAFFDSHQYTILNMAGSEGWVIEPELELPTAQQAAGRDKLRAELKAVEAKLKTQTPELDTALAQWEAEQRAEPQRWHTLEPLEFKSSGGTKLEKLADSSLLAAGAAPVSDVYTVTAQLPASAQGLTALRLEALTDANLPQGGPGRNPYGNFVLSGIEIFVETAGGEQRIALKDAAADDFTRSLDERQLFSQESLPGSGWDIDATRDAKRLNRQIVFIFEQPLELTAPAVATIQIKQIGQTIGQGLGRVRLSVIESNDPTRIVALPLRFKSLLEAPAAKRNARQQTTLAEQFRQLTPLLKAERERAKQLRDAIINLGIVSAQIIREKQTYERPSTLLRVRGNYLNKGEKVYAATPAALHAWPEDAPYNRLGLARWLVSKENPLTARVTVNRAWEQFFGRGIIETVEDFGSQCAPPTHPELLDWLAVEFMESGWSMKKLHRLIVTSAAYRQTSKVTPALLEKDPYNRLFARGPRFRLDAETIRDSALLASGLLSRKLGGPPVYPAQPDGIWMNPYDGNNIKWQTSTGADRYRRSLYTFLRRTAPFPMLTTFDATSREYCTVRRVRTNTPLQALSLLNDEAFFEMARALARRMLTEANGGLRARLSYGFRLCVLRAPSQVELEKLEQLYQRQLALYRADKAAAQRVAKGVIDEGWAGDPAEAAAFTMTANVLLNLDEMLTKE